MSKLHVSFCTLEYEGYLTISNHHHSAKIAVLQFLFLLGVPAKYTDLAESTRVHLVSINWLIAPIILKMFVNIPVAHTGYPENSIGVGAVLAKEPLIQNYSFSVSGID